MECFFSSNQHFALQILKYSVQLTGKAHQSVLLNVKEKAKSETVSHTVGLSSVSVFRGKCTQIDKQRNRFILTEVGSYRCSLNLERYFLSLGVFIKLLAGTWRRTSLLSRTCFLCEAFMQVNISHIYSRAFSVNCKLIFKLWVGYFSESFLHLLGRACWSNFLARP